MHFRHSLVVTPQNSNVYTVHTHSCHATEASTERAEYIQNVLRLISMHETCISFAISTFRHVFTHPNHRHLTFESYGVLLAAFCFH